MLFQYQAGPRSSYRLISSSPNVIVSANGGGSLRIGVSLDNGAVRSTTSIVPALIPDTSSDRTPITPPRRCLRPRCVQVSLERRGCFSQRVRAGFTTRLAGWSPLLQPIGEPEQPDGASVSCLTRPRARVQPGRERRDRMTDGSAAEGIPARVRQRVR